MLDDIRQRHPQIADNFLGEGKIRLHARVHINMSFHMKVLTVIKFELGKMEDVEQTGGEDIPDSETQSHSRWMDHITEIQTIYPKFSIV